MNALHRPRVSGDTRQQHGGKTRRQCWPGFNPPFHFSIPPEEDTWHHGCLARQRDAGNSSRLARRQRTPSSTAPGQAPLPSLLLSAPSQPCTEHPQATQGTPRGSSVEGWVLDPCPHSQASGAWLPCTDNGSSADIYNTLHVHSPY